jgi:hypothetical protein
MELELGTRSTTSACAEETFRVEVVLVPLPGAPVVPVLVRPVELS